MLPKYNVLTEEQVLIIHNESIKILEEIGMDFEYYTVSTGFGFGGRHP